MPAPRATPRGTHEAVPPNTGLERTAATRTGQPGRPSDAGRPTGEEVPPARSSPEVPSGRPQPHFSAAATAGGRSRPSPLDIELGRWWAQLRPILGRAALASLGIVYVAKVLRVSRGDFPTALAILEASDQAALLAGLLLLTAPLLIAAGWAASCFSAAADYRRLKAVAPTPPELQGAVEDAATRAMVRLVAAVIAAALFLWLLLAVCPWRTAAVVGAAVPLLAAAQASRPTRLPKAPADDGWLRRLPPHRVALVLAAPVALGSLLALDALLSPVLADDMWLPPHRLDAGGAPVVGYVLAREDDVLVVLTEPHRRVVRLPAETVLDDRLCSLKAAEDARSTWDVTGGRPRNSSPAC